MKIRPSIQSFFLALVVFSVYLNTLSAEINTVDDLNMVMRLENQESFRILGLFRPGSTFYYRPLLMLTFYWDKFLWGLEPSFMHLENMLLHAANAVLVFKIARRVFDKVVRPVGYLPLVCALLFSLHPINTESVNWISGRTDLLATFFVLLSCRILIWTVEARRPALGLLSAAFFLAGVMSKEVTLFFLPVGCFLMWRWPSGAGLLTAGQRLRGLFCFAGPFLGAAASYATLRFARFGLGDAGVNYIFDNYLYDPLNTTRVVFKVLGFYVKKLFIPFPLSFAITSANDHYVWLGLLAMVVVVALVWLRRIAADFLAISFFLISPAVIVALTNVAWTPLAERYLYLPSAFWSIAMVGFVYQSLGHFRSYQLAPAIVIVLLAGMGWGTYERNLVWQSNLTLFNDAIRKNPEFPPLRSELAIALKKKGRGAEAEEQLAIATGLDPKLNIPHVHLNRIQILAQKKQMDEARPLLKGLLQDLGKKAAPFQRQVARVIEELLRHSRTEDERRELLGDLMQVYEQILVRTKDPFVYYRTGQIALLLGREEQAAACFAEAFQRSPVDAYYRQAAGNLANKLSKNENYITH